MTKKYRLYAACKYFFIYATVKLPIEKLYEELEECGIRLMKYKECFTIMGKECNSYFKTDREATFMTKGTDLADERRPYAERTVKTGKQ